MHVLALDSGSSSLKYALYDMPQERLIGSGALERSGDEQTEAFDDLIKSIATDAAVDAVGHRIVLGSPDHLADEVITDALVSALAELVVLEPLHLPAQLALVRRARTSLPSAQHIACFDTSFFADTPAVARRYPLPASLGPALRRYGYHGISCEYIVSTGLVLGRAIIAHLGSGASMTALRDGAPLDTTMGFSPLGGLMMGTRPGDLDPGVALFLLRSGAAPGVEALTTLLNERSGLKGVSESSSDVRELLSRYFVDDKAKSAIDLFVYIAVKHAGALAAVCGGLDTLVFTGGIGERAAPVRAAICAGLAHLGVEIDEALNVRSADRISPERSKVDVRVIPTNEAVVIARHTHTLLDRSR